MTKILNSKGSIRTVIYTEPTVCANTDVEVNGTPEGSFAAGSTIEVNITDGVNPVTPDAVTVVGDVVTIEVPTGGAAPVGATLMKTGQTTSYRTGDDGDIEAGRAADFYTLASNNPFGSTARFTDELGGSTYANNIVIDWSTYNGATVLGYYRGDMTTNRTWDAAIDWALALSISTFTSGWRLVNLNELFNICIYQSPLGGNTALRYAPISAPNSINFWTSTTYEPLNVRAIIVPSNTGIFNIEPKTSSLRTIAVRTFTVTGTTLT